ncbi:MAG: ferrous iron transport protein B [Gemmatimonadetes bacterium]|nr:ferrous iron transport protein B [Gemmatimonadota bacterium]
MSMHTQDLPLHPDANAKRAKETFTIALAGSPNTGKTSLFNALTGLRAQTANFPGTTVERRVGRTRIADRDVSMVDLPGLYSMYAATAEERVACDAILGKIEGVEKPDAVVVIADADNIQRSLFLVSQLTEHSIPVVVALNMIDVAERHGIHVDHVALGEELGCPVVPLVARTGRGVDDLRAELARIVHPEAFEPRPAPPPRSTCDTCGACPFQSRYSWSDEVVARCVTSPRVAPERKTARIDRALTHPVIGLGAFLTVMFGVFYMIFAVASVPMDLIDALFSGIGGWVASIVPAGDFQSLLVDGIIGGVGGILVFLPQITILFFFLALLEDSGYLARAAFVMDRLMRRIGLPGTAFVPLLAAHACAIPAIMASRVVRNPRDRLVTILVAPLMTCSARIPVYAMVTALLFPDNPGRAATVFMGAYALGIAAALVMAWVFKKTILPGESKPLVLELPGYRLPSLKTALIYTYDRALVFVQQAGTIILLISVVLWGLATYPKSDAPAEALAMRAQAEQMMAADATGEAAGGNVDAGTGEAAALVAEADHLTSRNALSQSFAGRIGRFIEPAVSPLGFDWQIGIGIVSSFAAREVIVSTLSIVYGLGEDAGGDNPTGLYDTMRLARRADGSPVFTIATSISLLVFYVLAMQCLPTQAVTKRETNSWKWPIFQLAYMTVLAYGASFAAFRIATFFGGG